MRTILVDDEIRSLNSLHQKLIKHCPELEIISACRSAAEGLKAIEDLKPELVFLDIEMPIMNGFTLLQNLKYKKFELIFVTAYDQYAIKAIQYSALDYLLKPVEVELLQEAVKKAISKATKNPNKRLELLLENFFETQNRFSKIAIPTMEGLIFIKVADIVYFEAQRNYTFIYHSDRNSYLVSRTMKEYEDILPSDTFIRIHHSFIINKNYVEKYIRGEGGQVVLEGNITLNVSRRKKNNFLRIIGM